MGNQMPDFEQMMKEMQNMGADGTVNDGDAFMGMMQGMMENLLSKELLYPSLKEIREKVNNNCSSFPLLLLVYHFYFMF